MRKIYTLLTLLLLWVGAMSSYATGGEWTNKYVRTVGSSITSLPTEAGYYLLYNAGRGTWLNENSSNKLWLNPVTGASGSSNTDVPTADNVQTAFRGDDLLNYVVYVIPSTSDGTTTYTFQFESGGYMPTMLSGWAHNGMETSSTAVAYTNATSFVANGATYYVFRSTEDPYYYWNGNGDNNSYPASGSFTGWGSANYSSVDNSSYLLYPVTLGDKETVTYNLYDSDGTSLLTTSTSCLIPTTDDYSSTDVYPTVPSSNEGFYTISAMNGVTLPTSGGAVSETDNHTQTYNMTIEYATEDGVPTISSSVDNANWMSIQLRKATYSEWNIFLAAMSKTEVSGGVYCNPLDYTSNSASYYQIPTSAFSSLNNVNALRQWCVLGNPIDGFQFINKWNGYAIAVGSSTVDGNNCIMVSPSSTSYNTRFDIIKESNGKWDVKNHGGNAYLSDYNGREATNLKFYNKGAYANDGDDGSAFTFGDVSALNDFTYLNIPDSPSSNVTSFDFAAAKADQTNTGDALYNAHNNITLESGKYYTIHCADESSNVNYYHYLTTTATTLSTDGNTWGNRTVKRAKESAAKVPQLWTFDNVSGTTSYKIRNANTNLVIAKIQTGDWGNSSAIDMPTPAYETDDCGYTFTLVDGCETLDQFLLGNNGGMLNAWGEVSTEGGMGSWSDATSKGNWWYITPVTEIPVTIYEDTQYTAVCYPFGVDLSSCGLEAYIVSSAQNKEGISDDEATLTSIGTNVPANIPVFIAASDDATPSSTDSEAGTKTYNITIANSVTNDQISGNLLEGTTVSRTGFAANSFYALTTDGSAAVMRPNKTYTNSNNEETYVSTIPCNRAYLPMSNVTNVAGEESAQALYFNFGNPTAISNIATDNAAEESNVYFDLNGRRVLYPVHGIYVKGNGQKVYIK